MINDGALVCIARRERAAHGLGVVAVQLRKARALHFALRPVRFARVALAERAALAHQRRAQNQHKNQRNNHEAMLNREKKVKKQNEKKRGESTQINSINLKKIKRGAQQSLYNNSLLRLNFLFILFLFFFFLFF